MADQETKTAAELAAEVKTAFDKSLGEVKELGEKALAEAARGVKSSDALKERVDEALTNMAGLKAQLATIDQKLARAEEYRSEAEGQKSLGQMFTETEGVKSFLASTSKRGKVDMVTKATITSSTANAAGAAGAALQTTRLPGINTPANRRMTVRDLIMPGSMDQSAVEFVKETGFTNSAAPVAEGAAKPQSDIKLALVSTTARVIAHTAKVSRQMLEDVAMLQSYIDGRLRYGLAYKEDDQLLNGDGTGQNLLGLIPQATAYSAAFTPASAQAIDTLRLMALQVNLAEYASSAFVLNPTDWARIELTKDSTGRYIIGNPGGNLAPTLWGLPVVTTQAIAVDKALTGAFDMGAQLFDRWVARVEIATENEDDFVKNLVTMLCEERLALAVYRPEAFVYADLGFVV